MEQSPEIDKITPVFLKTNGIVVIEESENQHLRSRYADLIAVWKILQPILHEAEIGVSQWPGALIWAGDKPAIEITTQITHGNQWMRRTMVVPLPEITNKETGRSVINFAQRMGWAITYGKRHALIAVFGLVTGDDDDAASFAPRAHFEEPPIEATLKDQTWQEMLRTGSWQAAPAPGDEAWGTLKELKPGELKKAIADNQTNEYANSALVAAAAALVMEQAKKRNLTVDVALKSAGWTGETDIEKMQPADLMPAYNAIVALPKETP